MESDLTRQFLALGYSAQRNGADLLSADGREVYEIKIEGRGVRDLRDAALHLATFFAGHPAVERAYVLASFVRIGAGRLKAEWNLIKQVLLPELGGRMYLVAVVDGTEVREPAHLRSTPVIDRFLEFVRSTSAAHDTRLSSSQDDQSRTDGPPEVTWKHLEIEKVLVRRWLLDEGPIAVGILGKQVGCSYPTALQALRRLSGNGLIERGRGRSVALTRYPRDRWAELLRAQRLVYPPEEFVDPTAAPTAVDEILRRLNRLHPKGAAMGGVLAARKWDPLFDLNGTPRIDLLLHRPLAGASYGRGRMRDATEFVRRLDPALRRRSPEVRGATVLALHRIYRQDPLFLTQADSPLPWVDPVETLYHLNDLGLTAQAGRLLRHLRDDTKL